MKMKKDYDKGRTGSAIGEKGVNDMKITEKKMKKVMYVKYKNKYIYRNLKFKKQINLKWFNKTYDS